MASKNEGASSVLPSSDGGALDTSSPALTVRASSAVKKEEEATESESKSSLHPSYKGVFATGPAGSDKTFQVQWHDPAIWRDGETTDARSVAGRLL